MKNSKFEIRISFVLRILCFGFVLLGGPVTAQVFRPVDPTKQADDVMNKTVTPGSIEPKTLQQPSRNLSRSSRTDEKVNLNQIHLNNVDLQTLQKSTLPVTTVPNVNFTAKRAVVEDKMKPERDKRVEPKKAVIKDRRLHPFLPGGEEELKEQLSTPR
jgi:hypothetical protein